MTFKLVFPGGYRVSDVADGNTDVFILFEDERVFVATVFTMPNVARLLSRDGYFWSSDMLIVEDLAKETIKEALRKTIDEDIFSSICSFIGSAQAVIPDFNSYEAIQEE